jgi:Protein of unknown function (DUF3887)
MRVFERLALVGAFALMALGAPCTAIADQSAPPAPAVTADPALTTRFTTFFSGVLAGSLPASGVTDAMKTAFTPDAMNQLKNQLAPLGAFQKLQFSREDSVQGYTRYHYVAVFDKGTFPVIFVIDSNANIAGFFADQGQ